FAVGVQPPPPSGRPPSGVLPPIPAPPSLPAAAPPPRPPTGPPAPARPAPASPVPAPPPPSEIRSDRGVVHAMPVRARRASDIASTRPPAGPVQSLRSKFSARMRLLGFGRRNLPRNDSRRRGG